MPDTNTFSAKDLATQCGTDAKSVRKFLRSHLPADEQPGQGGRYVFTKTEIKGLVKAYKTWVTPKQGAAKKPSSRKVTPEIEDLSSEEIEDFEDVEEAQETETSDATAADEVTDQELEELDTELT